MISQTRRLALSAKAETFAQNLEPAVTYLLERGISREAAALFGLGYVPREASEFAGRLAVPYRTPGGVVAIKYRAMDEPDPKYKYLNEPGCGVHLYNAGVLLTADKVVLTEGELDAVAVQAYTGIPAVAYPGVSTWQSQEHFRLCFERHVEVVVIADADAVGREAAARVASSIGYNARVIHIPDGMQDANYFIAQQGADAFLALIQ
jgi:DNA primase